MRAITVLITALGGEGGGVLAEWLVETAQRAGYPVQSTSIPGVAQRTGATTYYVEIFPVASADLDGKRPVFSLYPVAGALDLLVSSELLETVRQIGAGMVTPDRTHVVTSTSRSLTTAEKMQLGDGRAASADLLAVVREYSQATEAFDMAQAARAAGTVISAVLFGSIAGSGVLPFAPALYEATVRASEKGAAASLRGFAAALATVRALRAEKARVDDAVDAAMAGVEAEPTPRVAAPPERRLDLDAFPAELHELIGLGHARLVDYQDVGYAGLYLDRLRQVLAAERAADPSGMHGHATTGAAARWLALWMAFDDIVRVADLKTRAARFARVRREVKAGDGEVVRIVDHFKPGIAELAALLPAAWATALVRREKARVGRGHDPLALPLRIRTHTVFGFALLRFLATLKRLRRRGSRHAAEQAMIERWLHGIDAAARRHAGLGFEVAECGRLIKGYGATNERGKENLLHVLDHLADQAAFADDDERAAAIRAARHAALVDESGKALDLALGRHGAPPRPLPAQPIRWVGARPGRPQAGRVRGPDMPV